ncbi:MAG TPA: cytochrome c biogenesis protein CcsA [Candidatus Polarisedimenticolia bacterium]|nr:cytochrome c biogenesis protein CcsA [Candidatus Polarisedimenticolia bacterium]
MPQLATVSQAFFAAGTILLVLGFAAHVGHTVLLAAGRRAAVAVRALVPQPALAGVATGSFVQARAAARSNGPDDFAAASPLAGSSIALTTAAFAVLLASIALRAYLVGRGPWGNLYEFSVAFATSMLGGYLLLERRFPIRSIGAVPTGVALILALYAASLPSEIEPLVPALQNAPLLTIHVGMAVLSYGMFATAFAAGVGYLIQGREDRFRWLPSHRVLDAVAYRAVILAFPVFATMIILGSWWASIAWSRYWGWDPKETAALVTWLTYAIYLHARNQRAWAGRPSALLLVVGFLMVLVTYSGSLWFNGLHAYSGL